MNTDSQKQKGLYNKFIVARTDGKSEPGGKHEHCHYFVLDVDHDPGAVPALEAYSKWARDKGYLTLADDLDKTIEYEKVNENS